MTNWVEWRRITVGWIATDGFSDAGMCSLELSRQGRSTKTSRQRGGAVAITSMTCLRLDSAQELATVFSMSSGATLVQVILVSPLLVRG